MWIYKAMIISNFSVTDLDKFDKSLCGHLVRVIGKYPLDNVPRSHLIKLKDFALRCAVSSSFRWGLQIITSKVKNALCMWLSVHDAVVVNFLMKVGVCENILSIIIVKYDPYLTETFIILSFNLFCRHGLSYHWVALPPFHLGFKKLPTLTFLLPPLYFL